MRGSWETLQSSWDVIRLFTAWTYSVFQSGIGKETFLFHTNKMHYL